ncbi:hypothetical protein BC827DRAFT_334411 [Russula dissimulans]|nr:hypothetical protein BC827DRAFT_334411 [Russula dissimulans]
MRARDPTLMPHRRASERSCSPSAGISQVGSHVDGTVGALLDVMDVHAERQLIKTAGLSEQLEAVQNDMRDVAANVRVANSGREQDSQHLAEMHTALNDLRIALAHLDAQQRDNGPTATSIDERLKSNQAQIFQALEEIQAMLKSSPLDSTNSEAKSGLMTGKQPSTCLPDGYSSASELLDLTDIRQKLDMLVELSVPKPDSVSSLPPPRPHLDASHQVARPEPTDQAAQPHESTMHNVKGSMDSDEDLRHDEDARAQLIEQQAESVRYLNELNTWLETFVNGGTAQIMAIAEDVQRLCKALGSADELQGDPYGSAAAGASQPATFTVLQGMRRLADDSKRRDRDSAHLLGMMNGLVAALNEDMRKNAEMRNAYTTESVLGVIERQRQDQERMLRSLADELSDDIRGERLRFVEAMKEATAINVQIHVEEFKKELTREVLISTQEVGRLQRERQLLEQQIADLFAFYSKQKQTVLVSANV